MPNYCKSEKSCAEKVCESVNKTLVSYERCPDSSCQSSIFYRFGHSYPSCKSTNCAERHNNVGTISIVYLNIHCAGKLQHSGNHFYSKKLSFYSYMSIWLKFIAYVSANITSSFYTANSARICDRVDNTCTCSATTEKCTGEAICNIEGTCQGKYDKYSKCQPWPGKWKACSVLLVFHIKVFYLPTLSLLLIPYFSFSYINKFF